LPAQQRLRRRRSETHNRARLHQANFRVEPGAARRDLARVGFLVNAPLAARFPLEVLDDVGHIHGSPIDRHLREHAIQELACRSDKGTAGEIFGVARLLADQHQLGPSAAFAEDGLRAALPEIAGAAVLGSETNTAQG
jgi:hypothetical protein